MNPQVKFYYHFFLQLFTLSYNTSCYVNLKLIVVNNVMIHYIQ